ncbi:hypothetical protein [Streptomyces sp. NBC_00620]|uniref:hypothetical protein n=1 Tax=Streptomyces sp. NBC_00620 TaxID=2903666 RepID=UPI002255E283|nr:hypothetical protein [Streptomyces sp. NBC_00620]MCX4971327.1 hypothetical protein [Streptomyces sp. NBC_00620]
MAHSYEGCDEDFGLSGLTQKVRYPTLFPDETEALRLVERMAGYFDGANAGLLLEDVRLLLESPLPDEVIVTLWLAATRRYFDPVAHGLDGRAWLNRIADVCVARIRLDDPSFVLPAAPEPVGDQGVRAAVLEEIRGVSPALTKAAATSLYAPALPDVVPALERAVAEVGADLAFRLFLRAMKAYFVPIGEARHSRFLLLGERLGYHEFVVDDGCLNVWDDLVD